MREEGQGTQLLASKSPGDGEAPNGCWGEHQGPWPWRVEGAGLSMLPRRQLYALNVPSLPPRMAVGVGLGQRHMRPGSVHLPELPKTGPCAPPPPVLCPLGPALCDS